MGWKRVPCSSLLFLSLAIPASLTRASDGVIEINQRIALAGGVSGSLAADPAGFPVRIHQPGSYRLTGNLDLTGESVNTSAILVAASNVNLDLNGFAILGPVTCTGEPVTSCTATQFGIGVSSTSAFRNITVENGSIRGMALGGIVLSGPDSRIENVHATGNGAVGISTLRTGIFVHATATANGGNGIDAGDESVIIGAVARGNQVDGIHCGNGCAITDSAAGGNGQDGIETGTGASVAQNSARGNLQDGIQVGASSTVTGNTSSDNPGATSDGIEAAAGCTITGNVVNGNGDDGIDATGNSTIVGNTSRSNVDWGIELVSTDAYGENVLSGNNVSQGGDLRCAQVSNASAPELASNTCNGQSCYCGAISDPACTPALPILRIPILPGLTGPASGCGN